MKKRFVLLISVLEKPMRNEKFGGELATAAHITKSVISVFFRKNVRRSICCCFQNVALYIFKLY
jgi:hypothetical protein